MQIIIDTSALEKYSIKLKGLSRSAFPLAVRQTLNNAAFDMKQNSILENSRKAFINRSANFFKVNSSVDAANGFSVNTMKSAVGFISNKLKGGNNFSVDDLNQQEEGGLINKKSFIPTAKARTSNSNNRLVRANARLKSIKLINVRNVTGSSWGQRAIKSAVYGGIGSNLLITKGGNSGAVYRITSINRVGGNIKFKSTKLYSFDKNRNVHVKPHHFIEKAGLQTGKKMDSFFIKNAERQFEKALR